MSISLTAIIGESQNSLKAPFHHPKWLTNLISKAKEKSLFVEVQSIHTYLSDTTTKLSCTLTIRRLMKLTLRVALDYQIYSLFLRISYQFIDKLLNLYSGHEIPNSLKEPSIYVSYRYRCLSAIFVFSW